MQNKELKKSTLTGETSKYISFESVVKEAKEMEREFNKRLVTLLCNCKEDVFISIPDKVTGNFTNDINNEPVQVHIFEALESHSRFTTLYGRGVITQRKFPKRN